MNSKKIVITGGPATGKTSVIKHLESRGFKCFHEFIRELTNDAKDSGNLGSLETNPINSVSDPITFNQKLIEGRTAQFKQSEKASNEIIFFDRGIPDVLAYMNHYKQARRPEFIKSAEIHQYDLVFLLPMWPDIFATDAERFENFEEALKIQDCLKKSYSDLGYNIIEVPYDSVDNRVDFILNKTKNN